MKSKSCIEIISSTYWECYNVQFKLQVILFLKEEKKREKRDRDTERRKEKRKEYREVYRIHLKNTAEKTLS